MSLTVIVQGHDFTIFHDVGYARIEDETLTVRVRFGRDHSDQTQLPLYAGDEVLFRTPDAPELHHHYVVPKGEDLPAARTLHGIRLKVGDIVLRENDTISYTVTKVLDELSLVHVQYGGVPHATQFKMSVITHINGEKLLW